MSHGRDRCCIVRPKWFWGSEPKEMMIISHHQNPPPTERKREKAQKSAIERDFSTVEQHYAIIFKISRALFSYFRTLWLHTTQASGDHQAKGSENEDSPNSLAMRLEVSVSPRDEKIIQRVHTAQVRTMMITDTDTSTFLRTDTEIQLFTLLWCREEDSFDIQWAL